MNIITATPATITNETDLNQRGFINYSFWRDVLCHQLEAKVIHEDEPSWGRFRAIVEWTEREDLDWKRTAEIRYIYDSGHLRIKTDNGSPDFEIHATREGTLKLSDEDSVESLEHSGHLADTRATALMIAVLSRRQML